MAQWSASPCPSKGDPCARRQTGAWHASLNLQLRWGGGNRDSDDCSSRDAHHVPGDGENRSLPGTFPVSLERCLQRRVADGLSKARALWLFLRVGSKSTASQQFANPSCYWAEAVFGKTS